MIASWEWTDLPMVYPGLWSRQPSKQRLTHEKEYINVREAICFSTGHVLGLLGIPKYGYLVAGLNAIRADSGKQLVLEREKSGLAFYTSIQIAQRKP
jgi:hypothetical protein